jgi:hypothetical protein
LDVFLLKRYSFLPKTIAFNEQCVLTQVRFAATTKCCQQSNTEQITWRTNTIHPTKLLLVSFLSTGICPTLFICYRQVAILLRLLVITMIISQPYH